MLHGLRGKIKAGKVAHNGIHLLFVEKGEMSAEPACIVSEKQVGYTSEQSFRLYYYNRHLQHVHFWQGYFSSLQKYICLPFLLKHILLLVHLTFSYLWLKNRQQILCHFFHQLYYKKHNSIKLITVFWHGDQTEQCGEANSHLDLKAHVIPKENGTHLPIVSAAWEYGPSVISFLKRDPGNTKLLCELLKVFEYQQPIKFKTKNIPLAQLCEKQNLSGGCIWLSKSCRLTVCGLYYRICCFTVLFENVC